MQNKGIILENLSQLKRACQFSKPFLCCSSSFKRTQEYQYLCKNFDIVIWDKIRPNPRWDDMLLAADLFKEKNCDFIIAAGGGSVMDSAKCIKLLITNDYMSALDIPMKANNIHFLAIPTTSGTGSEVTKYSIFYVNENIKHSIANDDFLPDYIILNEKFIKTVPPYQRRCTCLDALSHAIESFWNTKSTEESKEYASKAIELFVKNRDSYIRNEDIGNKGMLMASYYAGKAINITSTTAAHALCYNVTMTCNTAHGHSVAIMLMAQWEYMNEHNNCVNDSRGRQYVLNTLDTVGQMLGGANAKEGLTIFESIFEKFELQKPTLTRDDLKKFVKNVNMQKLINNPTVLNEDDVYNIYALALL